MTIEELADYLNAQMPGYQAMHDWKSDLSAHRFYFHQTPQKRHILQVSEEVLADTDSEELKRKLEKTNLEVLFSQHPNKVIVLGTNGISFLELPGT